MAEAGTVRAHDSDHDLLIRIDTKLDIYMSSQKEFEKEMRDEISKLRARDEVFELKKASVTVTNDQESRLRKIERFAYIGVGISFVLQLLLAAFVGFHHV